MDWLPRSPEGLSVGISQLVAAQDGGTKSNDYLGISFI
jgi:hypothetical protein